jgi:hypothetical protein
MKANELMIGDWVTLSKGNWSENRQVELIDIEMIAESVYLAEPIPLTPEILEKNDFLYYCVDDGYYGYFEESYSNQATEIILFNVNNENRNVQIHIKYHNDETILHLMECNYVHQLQHILKVCGIKKEIEL